MTGVNGWLLLAVGAVTIVVLLVVPPSSRRWQVRPPATTEQPAHLTGHQMIWSLATGGGLLLLGWVFLPWVLALPPLFLFGAIVGFRLSGRVPSASQRSRDRARKRELPAALDLMASCLAAGLALRSAATAIHEVFDGPVRDDLARVQHHLGVGMDDRAAWLSLTGVPGWQQVSRDLARSVSSGTGLVSVLRQAAADARQDFEADQLARARTAGVRSVLPLMVCYLPAFLLLGVVPIIGSAVLRILG